MLNHKLYFIILFAILISACTDKKLTPIAPSAKILAFGDSLTVGVGTDRRYSYPAILAQLIGREVINAGVSGEVTKDGYVRLQKLLGDDSIELMILLEGGNDIIRNMDLAKTKHNLSMMIKLAQQKGIQVVLIGVPQKRLFSDSAPLYLELAKQYDIAFDEDTLASLLKSSKYKSDSVHLNTDGYRILAESIHDLLKKHGAI